MQTEKNNFIEKSYKKIKKAIQLIENEEDTKNVYALSFLVSFDNDDDRFPKITLGYNTLTNYEEEIDNAYSKDDAKWSFDFWLQNEIETIGGESDTLLSDWFKKSPYFYTDEENERAMEEDEDLFEKILKKGERFRKDFINEGIAMAKKLFEDKVLEGVFSKNIPIIITETDFSEDAVKWTKKANPAKIIKEYLQYCDNDED